MADFEMGVLLLLVQVIDQGEAVAPHRQLYPLFAQHLVAPIIMENERISYHLHWVAPN